MVQGLDEDWEVKRLHPLEFANEAGEKKPTIQPKIKEKHLPFRKQDPMTLSKLLEKPKERKKKYKKSTGPFAGLSGIDD